MEQNCNFPVNDNDLEVDATQFRRLLGRLLYLNVTRPNITYAVNTLCQYMASPRQTHMDAVERILRYLKITPGQGIFLSSQNNLQLKAYCDADWGGCPLS